MWEINLSIVTIALFFVLLAFAFMKYENGDTAAARKIVAAGALAVLATEVWLDYRATQSSG